MGGSSTTHSSVVVHAGCGWKTRTTRHQVPTYPAEAACSAAFRLLHLFVLVFSRVHLLAPMYAHVNSSRSKLLCNGCMDGCDPTRIINPHVVVDVRANAAEHTSA